MNAQEYVDYTRMAAANAFPEYKPLDAKLFMPRELPVSP